MDQGLGFDAQTSPGLGSEPALGSVLGSGQEPYSRIDIAHP